MRMVSGTIDITSNDGKERYSNMIEVPGWKPGSLAYIAISSWHMEFLYGDHNIKKIGMLLQRAVPGGWDWATNFPIGTEGIVRARFKVYAGSENMDNPYRIIVNYILIGE